MTSPYTYADVSAGLHGSSVSKFALIDSDVNIYLLVPETGSRHHVIFLHT